MRKLFFIMVTLAVTGVTVDSVYAQELHHHHESIHENEEHGKHKLSVYGGFTHVDAAFYEHETHEESTGKWIPTLGLEYFYTLSHKFDIGLLADMELDEYFIQVNNERELLRNNIVVATAVLRYKPMKRVGIFAGPGVETEFIEDEDSESFFVAKVGIDYEVEIAHGWELTPVFSYDFKEHYSSYSFGISLGKRF
ncbi:hypothetical protein [Plebeiibacterium marinum]|uniref:Outer membrane protein beta-barrel domain-containing protein n=1 Tax=Plebeiibacterium marinum TaxID=2992111 RepID=A0AAE3MGU4_9BACT|nr:hypothetical protein [Plebeiobacterium marinum]MCW3807583.1 hypothetical protein [Plebeiobacterium marinum]